MFEFLFLRVIHVLCGCMWVGAGVFNALMLGPALAGAGPAGGAVMAGLRGRGLFVFMPAMALLTVVSGLRLMWLTSAGFSATYFATARGATYAGAAVASVVTFVLGSVLLRPNMARAGALAAALQDAADEASRVAIGGELAVLRKRGARISGVLTALLLLSAVGMSLARYLA